MDFSGFVLFLMQGKWQAVCMLVVSGPSGEGTMGAEEDEEAELGEVRKQIRPGLRAQWRGPSQARR